MMSNTHTEILNWAFPNVCMGALMFIPIQDADTFLVMAGYAAKTLTFLGAMTVNVLAARHYILQNRKKTRK